MTDLKSVITSLERYERYGSEYYKIIDLKQRLNGISRLEIMEDMIVIPFYLTPCSTYEIYDYELNIRNVRQSNEVNFLLEKTGKKSLQEIDQEILKKLKMCYIEITEGGNSEATAQLKRYLEYLLNNPKVEERIPRELGQFDNTNLYFEVYF